MKDRELADAVVIHGDTRCFAEIVSRYSGMVFSKALGIVRREELAAEVTQQTFVKAYGSIGCWCGQSLAPWLTAIAAHTALNIIDKEKRRRAKPIEDVADAEVTVHDGYSEEHEQMLARMEKAIGKLPDTDRRLIELHYYKRFTAKEIAKEVGISQANVLVRLHRIRERLKKHIENEGDE